MPGCISPDWADESLEEFDYTLAVNARAPFLLSRCFGKALIDAGKKGVIVNISSVSGTIGSVDAAYAAWKASRLPRSPRAWLRHMQPAASGW